jgi:hypothetical protein
MYFRYIIVLYSPFYKSRRCKCNEIEKLLTVYGTVYLETNEHLQRKDQPYTCFNGYGARNDPKSCFHPRPHAK